MLNTKVGSFSLNTATGNQSITGLGFTPKVILFFFTRTTADGSAANATFGEGWAVSSTQRAATYVNALDNLATSDTDRRHTNTACITTTDSANALKEEADFVSMDADGFTINVGTASTAIVVNYLALGGSSLTNASVIRFQSKTTTGAQSITGVGFQPDAILLMGVIDSAVPPNSGAAGFLHTGFGVGTTGESISFDANNGIAGSGQQLSSQRTNEIVDMTTTGTTFYQASLTSLDADGFTLNWGTANAAGRQIYALCLKGANYKVGSFNQPTSTGNSAVTGVGFTPNALILASFSNAATTSYVNNANNSFGIATSTSQRAAISFGSIVSANPSSVSTNLDRTKAIKLMTPAHASPTVQAEADLVSFDADGFTLNWDTADATARQVLFLAFGSTVLSSPSSSISLSPSSSPSASPSLSPSSSVSSSISSSISASPSSSISSSPSPSAAPDSGNTMTMMGV